jgi:hypothetical protein
MRAVFLWLSLLLATAARAEPANTIQQLGHKLGACLARLQLHPGSEATVRLMLKRDGSIQGTPRITYWKLSADPAARQSDAKELADALHRCLPVEITDGLGGAIAGRLLTFSFGLPRGQDL